MCMPHIVIRDLPVFKLCYKRYDFRKRGYWNYNGFGNQHYSRELLMMVIAVPETCWAYKKYNKIISSVQLVLILQLRTQDYFPRVRCLSSCPIKTLNLRVFRIQDGKQVDLRTASPRLELLWANGHDERVTCCCCFCCRCCFCCCFVVFVVVVFCCCFCRRCCLFLLLFFVVVVFVVVLLLLLAYLLLTNGSKNNFDCNFLCHF